MRDADATAKAHSSSKEYRYVSTGSIREQALREFGRIFARFEFEVKGTGDGIIESSPIQHR